MKHSIVLGATLLLSGAMAIAQDTPPSATSNTSQSSASNTAGQTDSTANGNTIQGCLSSSSDNYTLTDANGMSYQLTGDESQLSANVNRQVEVMGTPAASASVETHTPDANAEGNTAGNSGNTGNASASAGGTSATA